MFRLENINHHLFVEIADNWRILKGLYLVLKVLASLPKNSLGVAFHGKNICKSKILYFPKITY
jgi:hypothetical protein